MVNFDMTPDGTKAVMAIRDLINPNEFSDGQTTKIFVKDLVTGSLTLIDDVDHSTGLWPPPISDDGRFVYFQSDKDGFVDDPAQAYRVDNSIGQVLEGDFPHYYGGNVSGFTHIDFFGVSLIQDQGSATAFIRDWSRRSRMPGMRIFCTDLKTRGPLATAQVPLIGGNSYLVFKFQILSRVRVDPSRSGGGPAIFVRVMSG